LDLPGPADTSGNATTLTASPLYGIRDWRMDDSSNQYFLSRYSNVNLASPSDRDRVSNAAIQQMRNELNSTIVQGPNGQTPDNSNGTTGTNGTTGANANSDNLAAQAAISPTSLNPTNGATPANTYASSLNPLPQTGEQSTGQSSQQRWIALPSPDQQSSQIADLETRQKLMAQRQKLVASGNGKLTPAEANAQYNAGQQYLKDFNKAAGTGAPGIDKMAAPTYGTISSATQPTGFGTSPGSDIAKPP
jgi:hypothetical protein